MKFALLILSYIIACVFLIALATGGSYMFRMTVAFIIAASSLSLAAILLLKINDDPKL